MLRIDHVGIVVPDLDEGIQWYTEHFGLTVAWREAETSVDDAAIGLPGEDVRLRGTILRTGGAHTAFLELHEYIRPTGTATRRNCDLGFSHIAFAVDDIHAEIARLTEAGMQFNTQPFHIETGGLAGFWWVYGKDPWGNTIELCNHPQSSGDSDDVA